MLLSNSRWCCPRQEEGTIPPTRKSSAPLTVSLGPRDEATVESSGGSWESFSLFIPLLLLWGRAYQERQAWGGHVLVDQCVAVDREYEDPRIRDVSVKLLIKIVKRSRCKMTRRRLPCWRLWSCSPLLSISFWLGRILKALVFLIIHGHDVLQ